MKLLALFSTLAVPCLGAFNVLFKTQNIEHGACTILRPISETQKHRSLDEQATFLQLQMEHFEADETPSLYVTYQLFGRTSADILAALSNLYCPQGVLNDYDTESLSDYVTSAETQTRAADEIVKIVDSGPPANRIDIVLMGDGYTRSQRDLFFSDMNRMTSDMFQTQTFSPYLPLFNIWALFRPSVESGLGTGGRAKNTAFGLYRDGTELRGVYCSKTWNARRACKAVGKFACDFPSLIANDPYYGGLGGEFTISTASKTSGTTVLRHEMGHNFGVVGEEYDGGYVYSGANSISSTNKISWKHWYQPGAPVRVEESKILVQKYPWYNLAKGKYTIDFTASGEYSRWYLVLTVSGMDAPGSFSITLDGKHLAWTSSGNKDRKFYTWTSDGTNAFAKGRHQLVMSTNTEDSSLNRQLCSLTLKEYKGEDKFQMEDTSVISLYPTFDIRNRKSYRPNNEKCLMRNMLSPDFCVVCKENMWLKFFARIDFIDGVTVLASKTTNAVNVQVQLLPLGQFRTETDGFKLSHPEVVQQERYVVTWSKNGVHQAQFNGQFSLHLSTTADAGKWTVNVEFQTPMVRFDPQKLLFNTKTFTV